MKSLARHSGRRRNEPAPAAGVRIAHPPCLKTGEEAWLAACTRAGVTLRLNRDARASRSRFTEPNLRFLSAPERFSAWEKRRRSALMPTAGIARHVTHLAALAGRPDQSPRLRPRCGPPCGPPADGPAATRAAPGRDLICFMGAHRSGRFEGSGTWSSVKSRGLGTPPTVPLLHMVSMRSTPGKPGRDFIAYREHILDGRRGPGGLHAVLASFA